MQRQFFFGNINMKRRHNSKEHDISKNNFSSPEFANNIFEDEPQPEHHSPPMKNEHKEANIIEEIPIISNQCPPKRRVNPSFQA